METRHILLVEDDTDDQLFFLSAINETCPQYGCYCADNGIEGLQLYNKLKPDVIFTDINMPCMNGIELLIELQKIAAIPIVVMSTSLKDEQLCLELGAYRYIKKPGDYNILCTAIKETLDLLLIKDFQHIRA